MANWASQEISNKSEHSQIKGLKIRQSLTYTILSIKGLLKVTWCFRICYLRRITRLYLGLKDRWNSPKVRMHLILILQRCKEMSIFLKSRSEKLRQKSIASIFIVLIRPLNSRLLKTFLGIIISVSPILPKKTLHHSRFNILRNRLSLRL